MGDDVFMLCLAAFAALPIALLRRPGPTMGRVAVVVPATVLVVWGALHARFVLGWWPPHGSAAEAFASVETIMADDWGWLPRYLTVLGHLTGMAYAALCVLVAQAMPARRARPVAPPG